MFRRNEEDYRDMIGLPHPEAFPGHPPMEAAERAAQFSPFAALSGYEEAVRETERIAEESGETLCF